ncbi:MAG TPA: NifU family protein [Acidimicrobiales bacterium]|nr:NifU family protein [Acidimicrobiales bacterium]
MTTSSVLNVTDAARAFIAEARSGENEPTTLSLFLEVNGVNGDSYTYDMWFQAVADAAPVDVVVAHDDLNVVVLGDSVEKVQGATLDIGNGGLVMINPNSPPPVLTASPVAQSDLTSPIEVAVLEVLEHGVNPQIAAHGGRADLVAVVDNIAYLRLQGGCQGCGQAAATLSQGIVTAIQAAVPEITEVVDITAHAEGANPYYAASGHHH